MAEPTWKDLFKMLKDLQTRVKNAPVPPGAAADAVAKITAERSRVANLLADMEEKVRAECFSVNEQSDFVPPFLK